MSHRFRRPMKLVLLPVVLLFALPPTVSADGFGAAAYPVTVSGVQQGSGPVFTTEAGNVTCASSTLTSSLSEFSETLSLAPTFSECKAFGFLSATVTATGCTFALQGPTETALDKFEGSTNINCEGGKSIVVSAATCEVQVSGQTGLKTVSYVNNRTASPPNFTATFALSGIKYTVVKDGIGCPFSGTGSKTGGTFSYQALMKASKEGVEQQMQVRPGTHLCTAEPVNNPLVCPAGTEFVAKGLTANLVAAAAWTSGGTSINCGESAMSLELDRFGFSTPLGGVWAWSFKQGGGPCTSAGLEAGNPTVEITVENLSYDGTVATYRIGIASFGRLSLAKLGPNNLQVKMAVNNAAKTVCPYQPSSELVASWVNGAPGNKSGFEFINQAFTRTGGGAPCPANLSLNAGYAVIQTGTKGNIYIAS
jgi:hypothetical protein